MRCQTSQIPAQWSSGRVSTLRLGGCGFDSRPGRTKDYKNGTDCLPAWHSALRVGLAVVFRSPNELWAPHRCCPLLRESNAEDKLHVLWDVTLSGILILNPRKQNQSSGLQLNHSTRRRPGQLQIIAETLTTKNSNLGLCFCFSVSVGMLKTICSQPSPALLLVKSFH